MKQGFCLIIYQRGPVYIIQNALDLLFCESLRHGHGAVCVHSVDAGIQLGNIGGNEFLGNPRQHMCLDQQTVDILDDGFQ